MWDGPDAYLVAGCKADGKQVPQEEAWHVIQDEAVDGQVERGDPRLPVLEEQREAGKNKNLPVELLGKPECHFSHGSPERGSWSLVAVINVMQMFSRNVSPLSVPKRMPAGESQAGRVRSFEERG